MPRRSSTTGGSQHLDSNLPKRDFRDDSGYWSPPPCQEERGRESDIPTFEELEAQIRSILNKTSLSPPANDMFASPPLPLESTFSPFPANEEFDMSVNLPNTFVPSSVGWLPEQTGFTTEPLSIWPPEQREPYIWPEDALEYLPQGPYTIQKSSLKFVRLPDIQFTDARGCPVSLSQFLRGSNTSYDIWGGQLAVDASGGEVGQKISLRLNWPNYTLQVQQQVKQLNFKTFRKESGPITKVKLVERVAQAIKTIMSSLEGYRCSGPWAIGPDGILFEDVFLESLEQVSKGSWQPRLYIRRRAAVSRS